MTHVDLLKPASGGLGFSVVGLCSENRRELGIFIQEIQAGSVAYRLGLTSIQYFSFYRYTYIQGSENNDDDLRHHVLCILAGN